VDERERQRACRARRLGQPDVALSRPGLPLEVPMLERDLLEIVDRHVELSRAGLRREVARLLRFRGREVGAVVAAGP
jgi:septum formation topological specificity factor MinE